MATSRDTGQDGVLATTDDIITSPGNRQDIDAISHALANAVYPAPAFQVVSDITVDKDRAEYVPTPALDEADSILQEKGLVILCGPSGCGKTTLAYALSRRSREQGFAPYVLEHLQQLKPEVAKSEFSVVVLDGTLGEVRMKSEERGCWKMILNTILELKKEGACRFVITVYPHVLRELQRLEKDDDSPLLDNGAVVWLTNTLPVDVREKLLKFHLDKLQIDTDRQRQVVEKILHEDYDVSGPVFPWCCKYMVKQWNVSDDPTSIFQAPARAYAELFKEMVLDHTHGGAFAALFSMTMKGVSFYLNDPENTETHLKKVGLELLSPDKLAAYAHFLQGSILSGDTFSSRVLYEAAGLALGLYFRFPVLVAVCDTLFLMQYVDIKTPDQRKTGDMAYVTCVTMGSVSICPKNPKQCSEDVQSLVKRIYKEIDEGNLQHICQHPCLQCPQFLTELANYCAGEGKKIKKLLSSVDSEHPLPLMYWSAFLPSHHLTHWCLYNMKVERKLSNKLLMACSLFDNIAESSESRLLSFLPAHFQYPEYTMEFPLLGKDYCLERESQKRIEIISETESGQRGLLYLLDPSLPIPPDIVTLQVTNGKLQLQVKDLRHWHLVFRLLTDQKATETDQEGNSLLHIAVGCEQYTAVRLCLKAEAKISQKNRKGMTPYLMTRTTWSLLSRFPKPKEKMSTDQIFRRFLDLDIAELQLLLLQHLSVNDRDSEGRTGLLVACCAGRGDIADLYIDLGAAVNVKVTWTWTYADIDINGLYVDIHDHCTPLHYACKNGLVSTVGLLIQHQANVNATTDRGRNALHFACLCSSHTASASIAKLLVQSQVAVNLGLRQDIAPLHLVAHRGHSDTAELLIDHGADVNTLDTNNQTPLHWAAQQGQTDTAELLISHSADVNTQDKDGQSPLHLVVIDGHKDTAELLIHHGAGVNTQDNRGQPPLQQAVLKGHKDIVELLIHHGADVNTQDNRGQTPLHQAALNGHKDTAQLLIHHGADVNTEDRSGCTPLHQAVQTGHKDTAELLIHHGADVNTQYRSGWTPLHWAALRGHKDTAKLLIHHGADVNTEDRSGSAPLQQAAQTGHKDTAVLLIHHGADVNTQDRCGWTPLHWAASEGHTDTAELLIHRGADVNTQDRCRWTPLNWAALKGHKDTAELLIHRGADVNTPWLPIVCVCA